MTPMVGSVDRRAPCPCGSGRRYKSCCFSKDRARTDLRESALVSHQIVDGVLRVLLPLVESRGEHKVACRAGCNACCVTYVGVSANQAALLAEWLLQPENAALLEKLRAFVPRWEGEIGEEVRVIEDLDANPTGPEPPPAYAEAIASYERRRLMCPFNDDAGNCAVYPVRPTICRAYNVVGTNENCGPDPKGPRAVIGHAHLSQAMAQARELGAQAAARSGKTQAPRALVHALRDALREAGAPGF